MARTRRSSRSTAATTPSPPRQHLHHHQRLKRKAGVGEVSAKTDSFIPIDIASLIRRCEEWAERCVEDGDVLPPASAFDPANSGGMFLLFDTQIKQKYGQIRHKVHEIISGRTSLPQSLENLFAVRCMALLAKAQIKLSFVQYCDWVKGSLSALDDHMAFYWALTYFWQYSGQGFRKAIWDEEIRRLELYHDTTLLPNYWTRGKVGDELKLEMAVKHEREAHEHLDRCGKIVAALKQRMPQKPTRKKHKGAT